MNWKPADRWMVKYAKPGSDWWHRTIIDAPDSAVAEAKLTQSIPDATCVTAEHRLYQCHENGQVVAFEYR